MKSLFVLAVLSFFSIQSNAQLIANDKLNIVYRGIPNPMTISIPEHSCKSLIVEVSSGQLQKPDMDCKYIYNADTANLVTFKVFVKTKKGLKQVGGARFRVHNIPNPDAFVSGKRNTEIPINALKVQTGMVAHLIGYDGEFNFRIDSFNYAIIRNEMILATGKNISAYFDKKIKMHFSTLEHNDTILFYNIYCNGADRKSKKLQLFELKVTK
jgi:hypothetical protein